LAKKRLKQKERRRQQQARVFVPVFAKLGQLANPTQQNPSLVSSSPTENVSLTGRSQTPPHQSRSSSPQSSTSHQEEIATTLLCESYTVEPTGTTNAEATVEEEAADGATGERTLPPQRLKSVVIVPPRSCSSNDRRNINSRHRRFTRR
jgi:hypothetical protein